MEAKDYIILLVDDENDVLEFLSYNLEKEGYQIHTATNGREAVEKAKEIIPHLILLDIMMPRMDGIETCEKIKEIPELKNTLIVFLTARGEDYSQIAGFDAGGDDYVTKPVKPKVLISRIKALFKRYSRFETQEGEEVTDEKIKIDKEKYIVIKEGKTLNLPKKEFELLALLMSKTERVFTRDEIYDLIWGEEVVVGDRTIDVHIRKLREKIGEEHIKTIKGVGYKYVS